MIKIKYASKEQHKISSFEILSNFMHKPQCTCYCRLWKIYFSNCPIEQFKI